MEKLIVGKNGKVKRCSVESLSWRPLQRIIPLEVVSDNNFKKDVTINPKKIVYDSNNVTDAVVVTTTDDMKDFNDINDYNQSTCAKRKRVPHDRFEAKW